MSDKKSAKKIYKDQKKKWKKGRRKATRPFKGLAVLTGIIFVITLIGFAVVDAFPSAIVVLTNADLYTLEDEDESAVYYESDFETSEDRVEYEEELCEQLEAEGAVLLLNDDEALPLDSGSKVTLLSHSSVDIVYGGTGSGSVDTDGAPTLKDALESVGIEVNETMWDFYESGEGSSYTRTTPSHLSSVASHTINEVPLDEYTDEALDSVADYGDAVIIVISRAGGEGNDLPSSEGTDSLDGNYLQLNEDELDLLAQAKTWKDEGTVDKIIVLINSANAVELDFLDPEICGVDYGIDAALWIGDVGQTGLNAVAEILVGEVNPSGRLVDTFCNDNLTSPAMVNLTTEYANADDYDLSDNASYYIVYQEGIYVGYRYYETRYEDYVMDTGNAGDYDYSYDVAYAFGYGLSYTEFEYSDYSVEYDEDEDLYLVTVTVTNVGDVAGKHSVLVYLQSPYTDYDVEYGIEKAACELVGFEKTEELEPGQSETLTIEVEGADLATYDSYGYGTYIMDAGTYYLTVAEDAHAAVNNFLAAKGCTPDNTDGRMDAEGDVSLVYSWVEEELDYTTYSTNATTGAEITNQFDNADLNTADCVGDQSITYLSRSDWEGTFPTETATVYVTDEMAEELADSRYDAETYDGEYADAEMPTLGADNDLTLADMIGLDYDNELWDDLLDQLTFEEMCGLIGKAYHQTDTVESIGMPGTRDENGPQGLTMSLMLGESVMCYTSEDVMAATFNRDLLTDVGRCIGNDCLEKDVSGLYGPGANIHRTPYSGRNFEYFSEDGYLSGEMLEAEVAGIQSKGIYVFMKHFALNDTEEEREGLCVWANQQAIREIYLDAFEDAVTQSGASGVMTSYSRLGCYWCGADDGLINGVLRGEWGCTGAVISDNANRFTFMGAVDALLAGSDCFDGMMSTQTSILETYEDDPVVVSAMREAVHRIAYTVANSAAMNGIGTETTVLAATPWYVTLLHVLAVIAMAAFVVCLYFDILRSSRYRKANPKPRKRDFVS